MPEYLSKEEVKQWRSSLEKITLEDYAARLGKVLEEDKHTNDLIDIVLKGQPVISKIEDTTSKVEKISSIYQRAFDREREISNVPFSTTVSNKSKEAPKKVEQKAPQSQEKVSSNNSSDSLREEVRLTFAKALTEREQLVFDYFMQNKNQVVFAKDLAGLLSLPRDYVYKYIKNLRTKIDGDKLQNSENGGYILTV